jgi:hypothetical protein
MRRDPDYIRQLADADYVDSMMRAVAARETHTEDRFSLAVLAALNIGRSLH